MFGWTIDKEEIKSLRKSVEDLFKEKKMLKEELEDLKLKKRLEQEEIKHMTRINEERLKMEIDQEKTKIAKEYAESIATFRKQQAEELLRLNQELFSKLEERMNTEVGNLKEIYQALMTRLPNVSLMLNKKV